MGLGERRGKREGGIGGIERDKQSRDWGKRGGQGSRDLGKREGEISWYNKNWKQ